MNRFCGGIAAFAPSAEPILALLMENSGVRAEPTGYAFSLDGGCSASTAGLSGMRIISCPSWKAEASATSRICEPCAFCATGSKPSSYGVVGLHLPALVLSTLKLLPLIPVGRQETDFRRSAGCKSSVDFGRAAGI